LIADGGVVSSVRYGLALIMVVTGTPTLFFWLLIHPFVRFWRKVGPGWTYSVVWAMMALGMAVVYWARTPLLAKEFGTSYPLIVLGITCLASSVHFGLLIHRHLAFKTLIGLPELAPDRRPNRLITEGLYARVRHPRYAQFLVGLLGYALIANYLAVYVVCALWLPGIYAIVVLEERELRDRFGEEYEAYCRRVPRFVPRFGRGRRGPGCT
jgi:protein-S-isoprenylcysteine O-methyltransferase Ste14